MIKTILWDFDGVILDSMKIKGDGFVELFKEYDQKAVQELERYHYLNGGVSRFEKIRYFFNTILEESISEDNILQLSDDFATIIEKKLYDCSNLIDDSLLFIKTNYKKYNFNIVSGAENNEINSLCIHFKIDQYFLSINGSPTKKEVLVKNILEKYKYSLDETILIGDSINDYNAADFNNVVFYGYNNTTLIDYNYISSFSELIL
jgi:phosphoglycolate phosphatase-like HAD superfamily hydrolase